MQESQAAKVGVQAAGVDRRTVAQEETHAPAENVTPGVHVRQLAFPAPLHVRHVAWHTAHVDAPPL